jgi:hypothetical protein
MLDQMHPELVDINRITLWEVHPIMRVELQRPDSSWVPLDSIAGGSPDSLGTAPRVSSRSSTASTQQRPTELPSCVNTT